MAKDVAVRELDQSGFRISNLGTPTDAGDATKTDNQSVPKANSGAGSPGTSFLAAPADHVHPASPATGGAPPIINVDAPGYQKVIGTTEELIFEEFVDLTALGTAKMDVSFGGIFKVEGNAPDGSTFATFRVRLGGTLGQPDGTQLSSINLPTTDFRTEDLTSPNVDNPGHHQLVKITAQGAADNMVAHARGRSIQFRAVAGT